MPCTKLIWLVAMSVCLTSCGVSIDVQKSVNQRSDENPPSNSIWDEGLSEMAPLCSLSPNLVQVRQLMKSCFSKRSEIFQRRLVARLKSWQTVQDFFPLGLLEGKEFRNDMKLDVYEEVCLKDLLCKESPYEKIQNVF